MNGWSLIPLYYQNDMRHAKVKQGEIEVDMARRDGVWEKGQDYSEVYNKEMSLITKNFVGTLVNC